MNSPEYSPRREQAPLVSGRLAELLVIVQTLRLQDSDQFPDTIPGLSLTALAELRTARGATTLHTWSRAFNGTMQLIETTIAAGDTGSQNLTAFTEVLTDMLHSLNQALTRPTRK